MELKDRELWPYKTGSPVTYSTKPPKGKLEESYSYLNEEGRLLFEVCRYKDPKGFRQRRPVGNGEYVYDLNGVQRVPFNLPDVIQAEKVFITEGEKDAVNLKKLGLTSSCNPMGALKWRPEYTHYFKDKEVFILPDNDKPGRKHAQLVARHLHGTAKSIKILELPGLPEKGDVSDWLAAGGSAEELQHLVEEAPLWQPLIQVSREVMRVGTGANSRDKGRVALRAVRPEEEPEPVLVKSVIPDAPVGDRIVVPAEWVLSAQGVGKLHKTNKGLEMVNIAPSPILITGRLIDAADGHEQVKLAFPRDGKWRQPTVDRLVIATTRAITELANLGAPVTSGNARALVQYFADFEAANVNNLPRTLVSQQMGWQREDGKLGFLWGRTLLRPDLETRAVVLELSAPDQWQQDLIAFRGADVGDEQFADAMKAAGSLEDWLRAIQLIAEYPRVMLAVYGALAPPLLTILGCSNFIIDWCNKTSTGKTTILRGAGSVWGNPDERQAASVVGTWDATRVWINRSSSVLHSLPLLMDDTKRCKNIKDIAKIVYDVVSGRDRGRGSKKGTCRTGTWTTVLLTTGETPITSFSTDGGTRARVLTLWGNPFGRADRTTVPVVQQLNREVLRNYGHAGPLFVKFLLAHQADWEKWQKKYHEVQEAYLDRAGDNPVAGRLCAYFAALDLAAGLAHAALDLPWSYKDPIENLWEDLITGADEADVADQALALIIGWAKANQTKFFGRIKDDRFPKDGWAGKWDSGQDWGYIAFLPHFLKPFFAEHGYEAEAVIRTWQDRGWLLTGKRNRQKQVRIDGEQTYTFAIRRSAIDEMESRL